MATRKDDSRGLRRYQAHRREEWLHDLKLELRSKSRFAFEMIKGEHQPPHGVISAEDAAAPEEFMVGRLSHSTVVTLGGDGSSTDEDASEGEADVNATAQAANAISSSLRRIVGILHSQRVERTAAARQPERPPASAARAAAENVTADGMGSSLPIGSEDGLLRTVIGPEPAAAAAERMVPSTPVPPDRIPSGAAVLPEGSRQDSDSEDEISLRLTPREDIARTGAPTRRDTMTSRMSNMIRRLQSMSSPIRSDDGEDSKEQELREEGKTAEAAGATAIPRREGYPLAPSTTKSAPSHGGASTGEADTEQEIRALLRDIANLERSMHPGGGSGPNRARSGGTRKRRTKKSASSKYGTKAYIGKMKFVRELSRSGMSNKAFLELDNELQIMLWEHCNEIIWTMIIKSLGHSHRHIVGRVADGDGMGAYKCMVLLGHDRAAGAQNGILSDLMSLQMHDTGDSGNPACMLTYYNALNELDARYARANDGEGVPRSILRTKLMELPEQYSFALHCLQEADVEDKRLGRAPKTCQEIVDYVCAWEATQKRIARDRGRQRSHRRVKRAAGKGTGGRRAYFTRTKGPRENSRKRDNKAKGNPHRNMRGRSARIAIQRARSGRGGDRSKGDKACYGCGQTGHFKRDCPNKHLWRENQGRAYAANGAPPSRAPRRTPMNHVGYVLMEIGESRPEKALSASVQRRFVMDSGATGHFSPVTIPLENARRTNKKVQGAGGEVMVGTSEGRLGGLDQVLQVHGLNQGLISVGRLTEQHNACVIFTDRAAYIVPRHTVGSISAGWAPAAHRDASGLYYSDPEQVGEALANIQAAKALVAADALMAVGKPRLSKAETALASRRKMLALTRQAAGVTLKTGVRIDTDKYNEILREAKAGPDGARHKTNAMLRGRAPREHPQAALARRRAPAAAASAVARPSLRRSRSETSAPAGKPALRRAKTVHRIPDAEPGQALITDYFEQDPGNRATERAMIVQRKRSPSEDFLDTIEAQIEGAKDDANVSPSWEGEPLYDAQAPNAVPDSLEGAEKQVLILASTGDMALACVVADRLNVDIQKVRQEMTGAPGHWATVAAETSLLTCPICGQPGWPDCDCGSGQTKDSALIAQGGLEYAFNYVDKPSEDPAMTFHKRMGHLPAQRLLQAFKDGGNHGIEGLTAKGIRNLGWCAECAATKQTRRGHPRIAKGRVRASRANQVIHTDTMERTIPGLPPDRHTKIQTFVDEYSRYHWVRFFKSKTCESFTAMLEDFEQSAHIQSRDSVHSPGNGDGIPVRAYFSDNASELTSKRQRARLASKLIDLKLCTPGESPANGIAERANRSVLDMVRVLLHQASLPLPFWPLAADMAVFLINRMPMRGNPGGKSPYELYYGKPPDRSKIRRFGCKCWVWLDKDSRPHKSKIDPTARPMVFCGYNPDGTQGVRVWDPLTQRIKIRYSLIFEEDANVGVMLKGYRPDRVNYPKSRPLEVEAVEDIEDIVPEPKPALAIDDPVAEDGWAQLYSCADEETLMDIGGRFGVDPYEIQKRNEGMSGCNPRTRLMPVEAPLAEGTEIWIPTDAKEEPPEGPSKSGSEEEPDEETRPGLMDQEQSGWSGRLRTRARSRRALKVQYEREPRKRMTGQEHSTKAKTQRPWEGQSEDARWCHRQTIEFASMIEQGPEKGLLRKVRSKLGRCEDSRKAKVRSRDKLELTSQQLQDSPIMKRIRENIAKSSVYCNRERILEWILDQGVDPDTTSRDCNTLLHMAAYYGRPGMCYTLLERGASPNKINRYGETALAAAAKGKSITCQRLLGEYMDADEESPEATPPKEVGVSLDTAPLLQGVIDKVKTAAALQVYQMFPQRQIPSKVTELCDKAHEEYARAYMLERMLLVESLRGIAARDIPTPKNFKEAVNSEFADYWNEAIQTEIKNLWNFETWKWVPIPKGRKLVDSTWAFRVKANQKGQVDRMKARLCARGYREIWGQDYVETHAPVTCLVSWRICMAQAAKRKMKIAVLDIKSAYLMARVTEDIYMSVPDGVTPPGPNLCLKLNKSLYGLKQAGRCWHKLLHKKMTELGMRQSVADPCLYLNDEDDEIMTVNVHVDDCCICYSSEEKYQRFRKRLEKEFQISKSDDSNSFLGMIIERIDADRHGPNGPVLIHQRPYIEDILSRYNHQDCKPAATPAEPGLKLSKTQMPTTAEEKAEMKDVPYRQCVGALLYLANCTRPDIAHAVGTCARFGSNPGRVHWKALKHVLRYLAGTRDMGIVFGKEFSEGIPHNCIHGYVDGDWGGDADDRRSTTGYVYMSYGGPVSWRSKKQASTALSSCESEYMAASEAAKEAVWLTRLLKEDLKLEDVSLETRGDLTEKEYQGAKPLTVFEDNIGCISLSKNPVSHRTSKHIEIRYHFVRERVQDGSLKLVYIPSSENIADVLTKSTRKHTFLYLRDKFMYSHCANTTGTAKQ